MHKIKLFSILAFALLMTACSKDDNDDHPIGKLTNLEYSSFSGSLSVTWDAYDGAYTYMVFVNGAATSDIPYAGTSAMISDIEEQDVIKVEAYSDLEAIAKIAEGELTYIEDGEDKDKEGLEVPSAPASLTVTDVSDSSATIQFNYTGTCAGINIYSEAKTDESTPIVTIDNVSEGENSVTIGELTSGSDYTLYLYAYNTEADVKAFSDEVMVNFTTKRGIAELAVRSCSYTDQYNGGLTMDVLVVVPELFENESEWDEAGELVLELYSSDTEDGEYKKANYNDYLFISWEYSSIASVTAWKNDMDFVDGNTYYLKAILKNENGDIIGQTAVQEVKFEEPVSEEIIPGAPTNVELELDGTCVKITWDSAENATKYKVYVSTSSNMSYKSLVDETTGTSATDCDRGKNVKMYYQVVAISSTGHTKSSSVESIWL